MKTHERVQPAGTAPARASLYTCRPIRQRRRSRPNRDLDGRITVNNELQTIDYTTLDHKNHKRVVELYESTYERHNVDRAQKVLSDWDNVVWWLSAEVSWECKLSATILQNKHKNSTSHAKLLRGLLRNYRTAKASMASIPRFPAEHTKAATGSHPTKIPTSGKCARRIQCDLDNLVEVGMKFRIYNSGFAYSRCGHTVLCKPEFTLLVGVPYHLCARLPVSEKSTDRSVVLQLWLTSSTPPSASSARAPDSKGSASCGPETREGKKYFAISVIAWGTCRAPRLPTSPTMRSARLATCGLKRPTMFLTPGTTFQ